MLLHLPRRIRRSSLPDLLAEIDPGVGQAHADQVRLQKTVGFVDSLLKYRLFQRYGKCLLRSLVLFRFLRLQGWPVEIKFGIRRIAGTKPDVRGDDEANWREDSLDITGHSWLVLDGKPFLETEAQEDIFTPTYSFPQ